MCTQWNNNNSKVNFQNEKGHKQILINGNNNQILFMDSQIELILFGNQNNIYIYSCKMAANIIGNKNTVKSLSTKANFAINGNSNIVTDEGSSEITQASCTGYGNKMPKEVKKDQIYSSYKKEEQKPISKAQYQPRLRKTGLISSQSVKNLHEYPVTFERKQKFYEKYPKQDFIFHKKDKKKFEQYENQKKQIQNDMTGLNDKEINQIPRGTYKGSLTNCSICLCQINGKTQITFLFCLHNYHTTCILGWLKKNPTCPQCSTNVRIGLKHKQNYAFMMDT